jgi:hypothetical protein
MGRKGLRKEMDHTGYKGRWIKTKGSQGKIQVASERCIANLGRRKEEEKPEPRGWRLEKDHRPSVSRANKNHISSSRKQQNRRTGFLMIVTSSPLPWTGVILGPVSGRQSRLADRGVIIAPSGGRGRPTKLVVSGGRAVVGREQWH